MNDERLQRLYRERPGQPETTCPDLEVLRTLADGGGGADRMRLLDHVMACEECRRAFDLLDAVTVARNRTLSPTRRVSWRAPMAAAVATLVIGGGVWLALRPGPEVFRGSGDAVTLTLLPPVVDRAASGVSFTWRSVPGAAAYHLQVVDPEGAPVAERDLVDTTVTVNGPWAGAEGAYRWRVTASRGDGSTVRSREETFLVP